jgi:ABC-type Fe3+-citrate transport system substrate-binding protein
VCRDGSRGVVGTHDEAEKRTKTHLRQWTDKVQARYGRLELGVQLGSTPFAMKRSTQLRVKESDAFDIDIITAAGYDMIYRDGPLFAADQKAKSYAAFRVVPCLGNHQAPSGGR